MALLDIFKSKKKPAALPMGPPPPPGAPFGAPPMRGMGMDLPLPPGPGGLPAAEPGAEFGSPELLEGLELAEGSPLGVPPGMPSPPMPPTPTVPIPPTAVGREDVEGTVAKVVGEKLIGFSQDMDKLVEWKGRVDGKLEASEHKLDDLAKKIDAMEQAVLGKIGDYDKTLRNVGAELTAMQKIFQTTMPTFAENVRVLSDVVEGAGGRFPRVPAQAPPAKKGTARGGLPEMPEIDVSKLAPK